MIQRNITTIAKILNANRANRRKSTNVESNKLINDLLVGDVFSRINERPSEYAQVTISARDDIFTKPTVINHTATTIFDKFRQKSTRFIQNNTCIPRQCLI